MASSRPAPAARATLLVATILVFAVASCDAPVPKGSPVCRRGSSRVTVFQGPDGTCIARDRIVGLRCDGEAPLVVFDAGTAKERRFLGGAFAVQVQSLPEPAERHTVPQLLAHPWIAAAPSVAESLPFFPAALAMGVDRDRAGGRGGRRGGAR